MTTAQQASTIDVEKLMAFVFKAVDEVGATLNTALVVLGDKLGYYTAMAAGAVTPGQLAATTGTGEPYAREWLNAQAAGGYVGYDAATGRYTLPPEQAAALTDPSSPAYLPGFFQIALGTVHDIDGVLEAARSQGGRAGTSTTPTCTTVASGSSAPCTTRTWSASGCRRWTASWTNSPAAPPSRTSGADTGPPP